MKMLIKNGRIVDPARNLDAVGDILVDNGCIVQVATGRSGKVKTDTTIDATGMIVLPGLVDMHVHLREPGREDKETIATGTMAAVKGGVTSVLAMPNTVPAIDAPEHVALVRQIADKTAHCNVYVAGAITMGRLGKELTDIARLKKAGIVAISDDGASVDDGMLLGKALGNTQGLCVICHSEDKTLSGHGVVNRGLISTRLGLRGISSESEYARVKRDVELARLAGSRVHIAHVSCRESLEIIAQAKKEGVAVTCETAPHYIALTEEDVLGYDTNFKMNPPLRSRTDREAIRQGLKTGVIDAIASDHAPHTENEKDIEFDRAEFGVVGLETALSVVITELLEPGILDWQQIVRLMCWKPAEILGIDKGTLKKGTDADMVIVDPAAQWTVSKETLVSKSKNSSFLGKTLHGKVLYTICKGEIVYSAA
ncbi:MAG TPA: dihydroorotase [Candidatus Omnitrophota bacterium]|nr:dihydroorotase [Candidatus Omnitrophota bacterium]